MLSQISTLLYIKQGKLGFEKEGHTQKYDESFITLCDIMHLYFDPCLGRLLCHLQAKWTMLISWVWKVTDIKLRYNKLNHFLVYNG